MYINKEEVPFYEYFHSVLQLTQIYVNLIVIGFWIKTASCNSGFSIDIQFLLGHILCIVLGIDGSYIINLLLSIDIVSLFL